MIRPALAPILLGILATFGCALRRTSAPSGDVGGFVATLGSDTVHVERFQRSGDTLRGTIVTRVPVTRVVDWAMTLDATGAPVRYTVETRDPEGTPLTHNWSAGSMTFLGDTIVRETMRDGAMVESRVPAPRHTVPSPNIPYVGVSFLMYERAFADARRRTDTLLYGLTMLGPQLNPTRTRAWLVGPDSAELSYFGVAKSGYRFDSRGRLLRADWTGTTYRYRVTRTGDVDVMTLARRWGENDRAGRTFGALSPRDTMIGDLGSRVRIAIEYGRPAKRGRVVWGGLVPWDQVWRLGADRATHLSTAVPLFIGDQRIPIGNYTLWMIPSLERPLLIVSTSVNVFGTQYDPRRDFARIPMTRIPSIPATERLTISVENQNQLVIRWDTMGWSVPIRF